MFGDNLLSKLKNWRDKSEDYSGETSVSAPKRQEMPGQNTMELLLRGVPARYRSVDSLADDYQQVSGENAWVLLGYFDSAVRNTPDFLNMVQSSASSLRSSLGDLLENGPGGEVPDGYESLVFTSSKLKYLIAAELSVDLKAFQKNHESALDSFKESFYERPLIAAYARVMGSEMKKKEIRELYKPPIRADPDDSVHFARASERLARSLPEKPSSLGFAYVV